MAEKYEASLMKPVVGMFGGKFYPLHQGHVWCIQQAASMVDTLYLILSCSKRREENLEGPYLSPALRLSWLGEVTRDFSNVKILSVEDNYGSDDYNWRDECMRITRLTEKFDLVFSSETEYSEGYKYYIENGAKHILLDTERRRFKIHSSAIRKQPQSFWQFLPACVRRFYAKRILITGTESCGKSTMVRMLANHYSASCVMETGREYCEKYNNQLTEAMFDDIGMEHWVRQANIEAPAPFIFIDTDAVVTQYYYEMYMKEKYRAGILKSIISEKQHYDYIFFMTPDVAWVDDGYRFMGEKETRKKESEKLMRMYETNNYRITLIESNNYHKRYMQIVDILDGLF